MNAFDIIKTVRLTEKGTRQGEQYNQYTIKADRLASKPQIKRAVEELFKVKVLRVNTLSVRGKYRRQRTAQAGQAPDWKKAIVTLKEGDKISLT
ncbi:MAG TPA: 50S ribosomal protein L23 [Verrucomicrobiota bacterium]|nr:50S ribosomal protein L23 [Verrucomicrobiota bacterium]HNT14203.1 50S ribosomal protein L23 [Verrucomicrobiota bacterium]